MVQLQLLSCGTLLYLLDHSVNNPTLVTIYLIWSSGCISNEVPPYPTLYFKGGLWPFLAHNLYINRQNRGYKNLEFNGTYNTMRFSDQWQGFTTSTFLSGRCGFVLCALWFEMCSLNLLGTPRRGLCVRSHHHGKKVRERSSAFTITVSDLHSHFSFSCCTCQLMLLDSFFTAVVLGVGFNGALFVGASRWYRVSFPSIGPPLTLLLFSVA